MFQLVHYESAFERSQVLDGAEHVQHERLVVLHVRRMDFQQVVVLSRNVVALRHLGDVRDGLCKVVGDVAAEALHLHGAEYHEALV